MLDHTHIYLFAEKNMLDHADIEFAYDKKIIGVDLKSRVREEKNLKTTAVHEAGHTLVAYYTKEADKIHKVTIIAKGQSGGHMAFVPEKEAFLQKNCNQLLAQIDIAMGGKPVKPIEPTLAHGHSKATEIGKFILLNL